MGVLRWGLRPSDLVLLFMLTSTPFLLLRAWQRMLSELLEPVDQHRQMNLLCARHCLRTSHKPDPP